MPNVNSSFGGQVLIEPGAYVQDNVNAVPSVNSPATPPLIFLGYGFGGVPFEPTTYGSASDLLTAIRGGPCSGYVPFLTNPSPQLNGAQQITYINVGQNTQSTLNLLSGVTTVLNLTSADYGLPSNQLQVQVTAGTLAGKNISIYDGYGNTSVAPGVNLGVPFQLSYVGAATSGVSYTVTASGANNAVTLAVTSPLPGESATVSLLPSNFSTIEGVVNYLNGTGYYNAVIISNGTLPSTNLDAISSAALTPPISGVAQYANVTATLGDIVWWFNQQANSLATAAIASGVTSVPGLAPANLPYTLFTGATSVPPTLSNYASGFNIALTIPGWTVFADSNVSGVIALGTQHAQSASQPSVGRWRRFFTGSALGDSINTAVLTAQSQAAITTTYVYPGINRVDSATSRNTLYSGLYAAAAVAGMATGNPTPTPLTNKQLTGTGVEVKLSTSQINQLQQAGVMCLATSQQAGVPTVVSDLTTWQSDSNPENVFNQQVACRWGLLYAIRDALIDYVGTVAAQQQTIVMSNAVKSVLNQQLYSQTNQSGVLDSWDTNSLQLTYNSTTQTASVAVSVQLVGQNRFITATILVEPLSFQVSSNIFGNQ